MLFDQPRDLGRTREADDVVSVELRQKALTMRIHRARADAELSGDLLGGEAGSDQLQDLELPRGDVTVARRGLFRQHRSRALTEKSLAGRSLGDRLEQDRWRRRFAHVPQRTSAKRLADVNRFRMAGEDHTGQFLRSGAPNELQAGATFHLEIHHGNIVRGGQLERLLGRGQDLPNGVPSLRKDRPQALAQERVVFKNQHR